MTNLEHAMKKHELETNICLCELAYYAKYGVCCDDAEDDCCNCPFVAGKEKDTIKFLLEEYKESVKLKEWELDLLMQLYEFDVFEEVPLLRGLRKKGHFKGVVNEFMTIRDILDNSMIVSDDYEGFEDTK